MAKAGMGVDAGDLKDGGWPDFVVTNFNDEYHSLFVNPGSFPYEDWTVRSHLAGYTRPFVGWGTRFLDYDNDGHLDLIIVNGHINPIIELTRADVKYKEPPLLLRNDGKGVLQNMNDTAGPAFRTALDGRGLAVGDFDNDGDPDVAIVRLKDRPILLRNNVGQDRPWVGFQLKGTKSNRDGIGAKLTLHAGNRRMVRWVTGGGSYLSSQDRRVLFGLGPGPPPKEVNLEIRWPSGQIQKVSGFQTNRYHLIQEPATSP